MSDDKQPRVPIPLPPSQKPIPSSFDTDGYYNEPPLQKVLRRLREEPLIPLGCALTVLAFTNAYRAMRRGDHHQVQRSLRARVAAQAFTVVAMVAGGLYYQADRHKQKELWKLQQEREAEQKRQQWIRELEARDEEDKALRERLEKRRNAKKAAVAEGERETGTEVVSMQERAKMLEAKGSMTGKVGLVGNGAQKGDAATAADGASSSGGGSILSSLGGLFGSGGSKKEEEKNEAPLPGQGDAKKDEPKK